jgi:hypothetical protein
MARCCESHGRADDEEKRRREGHVNNLVLLATALAAAMGAET